MRAPGPAAMLSLVLTLGLAGCAGEAADERSLPDVPVQGGEALQVETDPAATDSQTLGTPGAAVQPPDSL